MTALTLVGVSHHRAPVALRERFTGKPEFVVTFFEYIAQEVREVSTLFGLVAAGIGLTIVAQSLRALQSAGLVYRNFDAPEANSAMWVVHQEGRLSEPARHFLDTIVPGKADT